mmetsp:Transcript_16242/g.24368  ORF Transcript_16242/g.24368 Transcript_16242/m.24368 type:complete len:378 (+) Transcript_16242:110-1243(+)
MNFNFNLPPVVQRSISHLTHKNALNILALCIIFMTSLELEINPDWPEWMQPEWLRGKGVEFGNFETIITPTDFTFIISDVVFLFEIIFGFVQLLPNYSKTELVQEGVSYWFFAAAIADLLSSAFFEMEMESPWMSLLSTLLIGAVSAFMLKILIQQSSSSSGAGDTGGTGTTAGTSSSSGTSAGRGGVKTHTPEEYWLLRFPFNLHAGWAISIFMLSLNNTFVVGGVGPVVQAFIGAFSLIAIGGITAKMLFFNGGKPNYVIPFILSLFTLGSAFSFREPGMEDNLAGWVIVSLMLLTVVVSLSMGGASVYFLYHNELKDDSIDNDNNSDQFKDNVGKRGTTDTRIDGDVGVGVASGDYKGGKMDKESASSDGPTMV